MRLKWHILLVVSMTALGWGGAPAHAQNTTSTSDEKAATFSADEMQHDKAKSIITASGNVEVNQAGRTLLAERITFDQINDLIHAHGNVTLHDPSGDVLFAERMEISGDLKNGLISDIRAVLADRSRFAARQATLVNDETMTLDHSVYTRCEPCKEDPSRAPLWQIKSVRVVHDRVNKIVEYTDSWLELAGVPILYMPYMSYPDPTVKRKSGFLTPRVGGASDLGFVVRAPYFHVLDDYSDLTLTPIISSEEYGAVFGQYREKFTKGELNIDASLAYDASENLMSHIESKARFDINDTWRWGADLNGTTTDTYMRRYGFGKQSSLTSQAYIEGFRDNNFLSVSALSLQGLKTDSNASSTPLVLPLVEFNHRGDADKYGAYNALDVNIAVLTREKGVNSKRISVRPSWNLGYTAPKGDIYKLTTSLGVDFFHAQGLDIPTSYGSTYNGAALRVTPQISMDWRWPFARRHTNVTEVLEPIVQLTASPYGGNSYKMTNEDSLDFDFNDANLFSTNRFTGYDRVESGPRANYGLKWSAIGDHGGSTSILFGQSYRRANDNAFTDDSGLADHFSDYVGKVQISPGPHLNLLYRTRIKNKSLDVRRNELQASGTMDWFNYNTNFIFFDQQADGVFSGRKELSYNFGAKLSNFWKSSMGGVRDMTKQGGQRSMNLSLTYDDECFQFGTNINREFYEDREIKPNDSIMFKVVFKTLGEVTSDVSTF